MNDPFIQARANADAYMQERDAIRLARAQDRANDPARAAMNLGGYALGFPLMYFAHKRGWKKTAILLGVIQVVGTPSAVRDFVKLARP